MRLTERQSKALKASIVKWEQIVAGTGLDHGWSNCPLCRNYYLPHGHEAWTTQYCKGCPVRNTSGATGCDATPYEGWSRVLRFGSVRQRGEGYAHTKASKAAAKKMCEYLKDILKNSTKK